MEINARNLSIAELRSRNTILTYTVAVLALAVVFALLKIFLQTEIIISQVPGMPSNSVFERGTMDKGSQRAILVAVTSNLTQINPSTAEYQKVFLQTFLAPKAYTKIALEISAKVARQISERELGSYYFIFKSHEYDPKLNRHFVIGDVHTVNAAKDSAQPYTFEYSVHFENYRMVIDEINSYPGDRAHNSEWIESNQK
jgi:hypothetical protein